MKDQLEILYRERLTEFCRTASVIVGDRDLGRDVVQDAFAVAIRKRRQFRGDGTLEAWVWRIVLNAAREARRRRLPRSGVVGEAEPAPGLPPSISVPFEILTQRQREVLFLHYYADLDYTTIGVTLGISPGTVGATLTVARDRLRAAMVDEEAVG